MGHFKLLLLTRLIELGSNIDTFKVSFIGCLVMILAVRKLENHFILRKQIKLTSGKQEFSELSFIIQTLYIYFSVHFPMCMNTNDYPI